MRVLPEAGRHGDEYSSNGTGDIGDETTTTTTITEQPCAKPEEYDDCKFARATETVNVQKTVLSVCFENINLPSIDILPVCN